MIKIFTGENRLAANKAINNFLGSKYEIIEGVNLTPELLPSLLLGSSLFATQRQILIRDLSENEPVFAELPKYLQTPHNVAIFESKLDKRLAAYKDIKDQVQILDFPVAAPKYNPAFDIYKIAKTDGKKAVELLRQIEHQEDPIMFTGLLVSQAIKDFANNQGNREKQTLKALSALDLQLKTSPIDPWLLVESFLLAITSS